jgi:hypothetical protein
MYIMYFSGQKPLHLSIKIGNKKLIKLIEYYETRSPTSKPTENQALAPSMYSPRTERNILVKRGTYSNIALKLDTSSPDDDSDHAISLTSARLGRSKKCSDMFSPELILPSISEKTEKKQNQKTESTLSRRKARRNSVSLPDLRDTPNCLVRSGENTPSVLEIDTTESDDDDAFINYNRSPRKKVVEEKSQNIRKCISENHLSFPSIVSKNSNVKRTLTESSIFSNSDDALSRNMQKLL